MDHAFTIFRPLPTCQLLGQVHPGHSTPNLHTLFSSLSVLLFAVFFFTAPISSWHYIFSYLFITNLLHLNVNSTRVELGTTHCVSLVPKWCSSGSSVMFIEWVKPFWKSSLLVNFCDRITSGSRQMSKKANMVEWKGNWTGGEENQLHPRLHKPCHSEKITPPYWNSVSSLQNEGLWQDDF